LDGNTNSVSGPHISVSSLSPSPLSPLASSRRRRPPRPAAGHLALPVLEASGSALQCWHRFRRGGQRYTTWLPQPRLPHPPLPGPHASCFSELLEGRRRGFPSPCSSPPWNCLELTQPIGRPGDPGEGPHSTKPKRRFQETFSQYASRIWPRVNKIQGPSLLAELEQETCPLRRSEPESHSTNSPQSSNCRIGNTRHRSGSGATNYNWRKEKKRDLFCPVLHRKQRLGWGTWEWDQNRTLMPEIARRRLSGDLPLRSCRQ